MCSDPIETHISPNRESYSFEQRWNLRLVNTSSLDKFNITRTIGVGAFGQVVHSIHKELNRGYAIKILNKGKMVRMNQAERVLSEKRILQSVHNEFLIDLRFVFKTNSNLFLVLPFVKGGELLRYIRNNDFDESHVKFYAAQVILAFEYLHARNIVYRDLKPENVLLDCDGFVKIVDFGFAKRILDNKTTSFVGTPEYMAPEMLIQERRTQGYGYSVDWWALGVFIYEIRSKNPPFVGNNLFQVFDRILKKNYTKHDYFSQHMTDLLENIFQIELSLRIGCGENGVEDFKRHAWFSEINWSNLSKKEVNATFVPECDNVDVLSNFPEFDEYSIEEKNTDEYTDLFKDF